MDSFFWMAVIGFGVALVCAGVGAWVASQKGRSPMEGAVLGFLIGPLGALIEALLPEGVWWPTDKEPGRFEPSRPGLLSEAPDLPWLEQMSEPSQPQVPQERAWLQELENRHRGK